MTEFQSTSSSVLGAYDRFAAKCAREHFESFVLADRLLSAARALLQGPIVHDDRRAIVLALLYGRVLSAVHAVVVLLRTGLQVESETVQRSALEAGFRLAAIARVPECLDDYLAEGTLTRKRAMGDLEAHLDSGAPCHESVSHASIAAVRRDIDREHQTMLQRTGKQKLRKQEIYELARDAGQLDLYRTRYLDLSEAVHHSARHLERALVLGVDGSVTALSFQPDDTMQMPEAVADVMVVLALAVRAFSSATGRTSADFDAAYADVETIHAEALAAFKI